MIAGLYLFLAMGALGGAVLAGYGARAAWDRLHGRKQP